MQFGGQTPLKLAEALEKNGIPILGTAPDMIDLAEDRDRFQKLLMKLDLNQPNNGIAYSVEQARLVASEIGFPLVVRPSYVLGGRAMQIIHSESMLQSYLLDTVPGLVPEDIKQRYPNDKTGQINTLLGKNPLLFDSYLTNAIEVDVDALCDGNRMSSSPASWSISRKPASIPATAPARCRRTRCRTRSSTSWNARPRRMAKALNVGGLMNVQFAIKDGTIYVLEVNPRASRTVPFVAKTIGAPIAKIAARIMAGEKLDAAIAAYGDKPDPRNLQAHRRQGSRLPVRPLPRRRHAARPGNALDRRSHRPRHRLSRWPSPRRSSAPASTCRATAPSSSPCATRTRPACCRPSASWSRSASRSWQPAAPHRFLAEKGITAIKINKVLEGRPHIEDAIRNRQVQLVINTTDGNKAISDSKSLRRATLMQKVPYYTTMSGALAAAEAIQALKAGSLEVQPAAELFQGVMKKPLRFSAHATTVMRERGLDIGWVEAIVLDPLWREPDPKDSDVERRFGIVPERGGRIMRVACVEDEMEIRIISAFLDRGAIKPE